MGISILSRKGCVQLTADSNSADDIVLIVRFRYLMCVCVCCIRVKYVNECVAGRKTPRKTGDTGSGCM